MADQQPQPSPIAAATSPTEGIKQPQAVKILVPSYASWFDSQGIHEIERRSLPEFFQDHMQNTGTNTNSSNQPLSISNHQFNPTNKSSLKTPATYKEYRDFMIHTYRLSPSDYLNVTTCRRHLTGDAGSILRVHSFLDQWGLINYQVTSGNNQNRYPSSHVPSGLNSNLNAKVVWDTPRGMQIYSANQSTAGISISNISSSMDVVPEQQIKSSTLSPNAPNILPPDIYTEHTNEKSPINLQNMETSSQIFCGSCGVLTTTLRYHCLKSVISGSDKRLDICKVCYAQGRFPSSLYSGDFIKIDEGEINKEGASSLNLAWTPSERFALLEGIEMHGEDWSKIADHVGTRSREQCLYEFLQLPIHNLLLDSGGKVINNEEIISHLFSGDDGSATAASADSISNNPILAVVGFLASLVHPKVAAAAAKAAITEADSLYGQQPQVPLSKQSLQKIAASTMGIAASKAKVLADEEAVTLSNLIFLLLETFLKKLDLKLGQFDEIERYLEDERKEIDRQRNALFLERIQMKRMVMVISNNEREKKNQPIIGNEDVQDQRDISVDNDAEMSDQTTKNEESQTDQSDKVNTKSHEDLLTELPQENSTAFQSHEQLNEPKESNEQSEEISEQVQPPDVAKSCKQPLTYTSL